MDQLLILELLFFKEYIELEEYIPRLAQNYEIIMQNLLRRDILYFYNSDVASAKNIRNIAVSLKGENIIKEFSQMKFEPQEKIIITIEAYFEEFWALFPSSDKWAKYSATRALKADKDGCRKKYFKLLEEYKHEEIMEALKFQIEMFRSTSTIAENKLKFFQNSSTWLNQKTFLEYAELSKQEKVDNNEKGLIL